jgi:hypothetical protein
MTVHEKPTIAYPMPCRPLPRVFTTTQSGRVYFDNLQSQNYPSQNQRLACCDNRIAQKNINPIKPIYASAKAKASAKMSAPHATNHSALRLDPSDCEESLVEVAIPDPESVGKKIKPDDSEPDCWRRIVLACKTSPAAMG